MNPYLDYLTIEASIIYMALGYRMVIENGHIVSMSKED